LRVPTHSRAIDVEADAAVELIGSFGRLVQISATRSQEPCPGEPEAVAVASVGVAANLESPVNVQGDVDLGHVNGLPIQPVDTVTAQTVDVRVLSSANLLRGFDLRI